MKKKKILYISHSAVTSFHLKKIKELSRYYNILLITPHVGKEEGVIHYPVSRQINSSLEHKVLRYFFPLKTYISFSPFIIKEILVFKPDLIYLDEEPMAFISFFIVLLKKIFSPYTRIIVYTFENIKFNWYFKFPKYLFYNYFKFFVLKNIDGLICATYFSKEIYKNFKKEIDVIPYYIDIIDYSIGKRNRENDLLNILFIGRLIPEKGIMFLLDAIVDLKIPYKLHIIGDGHLKNEILKFIDKYGIDAKLYGHMPHEKVYEIMEQVDCMVIPSFTIPNWKEQFGRVIIEAMAKGCLVVGSNSGAIPEVIGKYGFVFNEGDKEELLNILNKIYNKELIISKEEIKKYVQKNFSLSSVVLKTYRFIEKVMSH